MKEEADLEQNAERCVIEFVSLWSFRCRAVLVEPFKSRIQGVGPGAPQYSGISRSMKVWPRRHVSLKTVIERFN